ncbi:MAG: hypothetical protein NT173_02825, partial [Opitutales bacterium]|nr:hypothetical protein [Opitutales bacterium]
MKLILCFLAVTLTALPAKSEVTLDRASQIAALLPDAPAGLGAPALLGLKPVLGQGFPDRPIRLIVPWPPGGSTDTIARIYQPRLAELLGRPVVIDNRGGAPGATGAIEAARQPGDGS